MHVKRLCFSDRVVFCPIIKLTRVSVFVILKMLEFAAFTKKMGEDVAWKTKRIT